MAYAPSLQTITSTPTDDPVTYIPGKTEATREHYHKLPTSPRRLLLPVPSPVTMNKGEFPALHLCTDPSLVPAHGHCPSRSLLFSCFMARMP